MNGAPRRAPPLHIEPSAPPEEQRYESEPGPGVGLCLSGGGFRAMLFHLGSLCRLNEAGYLPRLDRVSSVSGGSITAGVLANRWARLLFDSSGVASNFADEIVSPLRRLASRRIDLAAIVLGVLLPGSVGNRVASSYRRHLFGDTSLQELPDKPRFVFNATSPRLSACRSRISGIGGSAKSFVPTFRSRSRSRHRLRFRRSCRPLYFGSRTTPSSMELGKTSELLRTGGTSS
jgi:Patatin-like phospholipase